MNVVNATDSGRLSGRVAIVTLTIKSHGKDALKGLQLFAQILLMRQWLLIQ